jgi:hypothetical protein
MTSKPNQLASNQAGPGKRGRGRPFEIRDRTGQTYGWLLARALAWVRDRRTYWRCECLLCGSNTVTASSCLTSDFTKSCGCLRRATSSATGKVTGPLNGKLKRTHGHAPKERHSPTYSSWAMMKSRCTNPNDTSYATYGGSGIGIEDPRWLIFQNFLVDMGPKPNDGRRYDMHRLDDLRGYFKENCEWVEHIEHRRITACRQWEKAKAAGRRSLQPA